MTLSKSQKMQQVKIGQVPTTALTYNKKQKENGYLPLNMTNLHTKDETSSLLFYYYFRTTYLCHYDCFFPLARNPECLVYSYQACVRSKQALCKSCRHISFAPHNFPFMANIRNVSKSLLSVIYYDTIQLHVPCFNAIH